MLNRLDLRHVDRDVIAHLPRPEVAGDEPVAAVRSILAAVREQGDEALLRFTREFDGIEMESVRVSAEQLAAAYERTPAEVREALAVAAGRIEAFHRTQIHGETTYDDGGYIRSFNVAVDRAGCYVPGGRAAYPSTVLMTAIPAKVAGVGSVVVCVPPDRTTGAVTDVTLAACVVAGVDEVYAVGGAQAIAAMAYGTDTIAAVDVICGPGNKYVAIAKREVAGATGIASAFAGPSEIVVVADSSAPAAFAAVDVVVQAEHGPDGLAWLVTWDEAVADAVSAEVERITEASPRRDEIVSTLATAGYAVLCRDAEQAMEVANAIAPEHLQIMTADPEALVGLVRNAGAIFCGPWSPASMGDYVAGPSHVLPTDGTARFSSALTVADFQKHHHVITFTAEQSAALAPVVDVLASAEGLDAHALSARMRLEAAAAVNPNATHPNAAQAGERP
ncbi:MAG: histidinol dehydrogenase [Microthrixaceae bacterium]|nr:histidinol dehydrogenase [Microthrixaceae bacterium]